MELTREALEMQVAFRQSGAILLVVLMVMPVYCLLLSWWSNRRGK